jgi:outer membrane protein assembly factor BamB
MAMSAYNGTILWKKEVSPGFIMHRNTFIASPRTLYLGDDQSCKLIDHATGEIRAEITVPEKLSDGPVWKWMALDGNILYALVGEKEGKEQTLRGDRIRGAGWPWWRINKYDYGFGRTFLAIDPETRKILWHHREDEKIDSRGLCLKNGRIYYYSDGKFLAALEAKTGKVAWKNSDANLLEAIGQPGAAQHWMLGFASTAYLKAGDDALFFAGPQRPRLVAASAKDGKLLWSQPAGNVQLVLRSDGLYALGEGSVNSVESSRKLDPLTGKVLATFPSRDRCTRATGCLDSIFTRGGQGGSTAVFDVTSKTPKMGVVAPMRPACTDGVLAANGYLYWGPWMCRCDMTQLGVISLGHAGKFDFTAEASDAAHLERAEGDIEKVAQLPLTADDWPAYRRDNARSVVTNHTTPAKMKQRWEWKPPASLIPSAPVTAGNLVIHAGTDGAIRALDAESGKLKWTAYTGGPMKYPPAVWNHRVYAGSGDGWVYCLEAATGRQLWRFRAAPVERTIPLYGTLSSTWPVGSGVLVEDGVVYGAAGISNFDGTHVHALDAITGKIRWQNHKSGHDGSDMPGNSVSVQGPLLLHNRSIWMAGGNRPSVASYVLADGKFTAAGSGRGKDLFVRAGQVRASGFPLHWRPEDDHFVSPMELETPAGVLALNTTSVGLLSPAKPGQKPEAAWTHKTFQEIAAVAVTKNAVLVTGLDREPKNPLKSQAALCAVSLKDGQPLWKVSLPASPTAWGLAVDRSGRIVVTLLDGRVLCYTD